MITKEKLKLHYNQNKEKIQDKLTEFKSIQSQEESKWREELAFCLFAANSSAQMGLKATELLKEHIANNELHKIKNAVHKKVRFFNIRSNYLIHNLEKINELPNGIKNELTHIKEFHKRRIYAKELLKGIGNKEASHYLRNLGFEGYAIIDKHILNILNQLNIINDSKPPKSYEKYCEIELKIHKLAKELDINVDALDLTMWSYITGTIIK